MAELKSAQLLERLESVICYFIKNIVLEVEASQLPSSCEGRIADGEKVVEAEIRGEQTRQFTEQTIHMPEMIVSQH